MIRPLALGAALLALAPPPPATLTVASPRGERRVPVVVERGFPAIAADPLGTILSMERVAAPPGTVSLRVLGRPFDFLLDAAYFRADGQVYTLVAGPYVARDSLFLPLQWAVEYLPQLLSPRVRYDPARARLEELSSENAARAAAAAPAARSATPRRRRVVAVDPGHGGVDEGMSGPIGVRRVYVREKDVTLAVARYLVAELESSGVGAVLTRSRDTLIALGDRGRIAGDRGADIFVSVHVNAADRRWRRADQVRGVETYILAEARTEDARRVERMENASVRFETTAQAEKGDPLSFILRDLAQNEHLRESGQLAELVHGAVGRVHPGGDRGVKQAGFMVLATSYMPAILVELGFGSNPDEARFLTSTQGQRRLARAIAEGIVRYLDEYERRLAVTP